MANGGRRISTNRLLLAHVMVGLLLSLCHCGTAFVPTNMPHRLNHGLAGHGSSRCAPASRRSTPINSMSCNDQDEQPAPSTSWSMSRAAAVCLATATICLSSSGPTDAFDMAGLSLGSPLESSHGAPTMMVLAEVGESADGRADVSGLVSDLVKADTAEGVLNTMVRINDVVDSDEEGLLENSFAKESIVNGLIDKRKAGGEAWDSNTETAFSILKRKLDPFNVVLLRQYLKIAPFLGGGYYVAVFFVQQKFRGFFSYAYFGAVAVFIAPAAIILLTN